MTASPLVTVLLSVHNGAGHVEEAVQSILRQTFGDFEFLIVDDGSTDGTPQALAAFRDARIRIVRNETNIGLTRSLNRGLAAARGTLIARQDADDRSHPDRLAAQVDFLQRHPDVAVLGTQGRFIDARGRTRRAAPWPKSTTPLAIRWQLLFDGPFIHTSVMFRRAIVWDGLGGYDESFVTSQDYELWSRVSSGGYGMRNLAAPLVDFRVRAGSVTTRHDMAHVVRLRPVVLRTLVDELGSGAVPAGWPDVWFRTLYPAAFADSGDAATSAARAVDAIHERFVAAHPGADRDVEIRRHMAAMFMRLANHAAERHRLPSMALAARALRVSPAIAAAALPRYMGHLMLAPRRVTAKDPGTNGALLKR